MLYGTIKPGEDIYRGLERICNELSDEIKRSGTDSFQVMLQGVGDEMLDVVTIHGRKIPSLRIMESKIRFTFRNGRFSVCEHGLIQSDREYIEIKEGHFKSEMQIAFY